MKKKNIIIAGLTLLGLTACSDFLEVEAPSSVTDDYVFSNKEEANTLLNGVYQALASNDTYGNSLLTTYNLNSDVEFTTSSAESQTPCAARIPGTPSRRHPRRRKTKSWASSASQARRKRKSPPPLRLGSILPRASPSNAQNPSSRLQNPRPRRKSHRPRSASQSRLPNSRSRASPSGALSRRTTPPRASHADAGTAPIHTTLSATRSYQAT